MPEGDAPTAGLTGDGHTFRRNAMTGEYVVYAANRAARPKQTQEYVEADTGVPEHLGDCPFCRGNEFMTPTALLTYEDPKNPKDWALRVVQNKYPAVARLHSLSDISTWEALASQHQQVTQDDNPVNNIFPAYGHHEIVIESPKHNALLSMEPVDMTSRLLRAWRERGRKLRLDKRIRHVHYFKNQGGAAGASLIHPHAQIVALPFVATRESMRIGVTHDWFTRHQNSVFARVVEKETEEGSRLIDENASFIAMVPFAALCPYEVQILPKEGTPWFENCSDEDLELFAQILHRTLRRLRLTVGKVSYNMLLRTAPFYSRLAYDYEKFYSWHCSIYPRMGAGSTAGFEIGSGIFSNSHVPEDDAQELRSCELD